MVQKCLPGMGQKEWGSPKASCYIYSPSRNKFLEKQDLASSMFTSRECEKLMSKSKHGLLSVVLLCHPSVCPEASPMFQPQNDRSAFLVGKHLWVVAFFPPPHLLHSQPSPLSVLAQLFTANAGESHLLPSDPPHRCREEDTVTD